MKAQLIAKCKGCGLTLRQSSIQCDGLCGECRNLSRKGKPLPISSEEGAINAAYREWLAAVVEIPFDASSIDEQCTNACTVTVRVAQLENTTRTTIELDGEPLRAKVDSLQFEQRASGLAVIVNGHTIYCAEVVMHWPDGRSETFTQKGRR